MKTLPFDSPVDANGYIAGFGTSNGVALRFIDYEANVYRFSLVNSDGEVASQVNGINPADRTPGAIVDEDNAAADIRAEIASKT